MLPKPQVTQCLGLKEHLRRPGPVPEPLLTTAAASGFTFTPFRSKNYVFSQDPKTSHTTFQLFCDCCEKCFPDQYALKFHMMHLHAPASAPLCVICGAEFKDNEELVNHQWKYHPLHLYSAT